MISNNELALHFALAANQDTQDRVETLLKVKDLSERASVLKDYKTVKVSFGVRGGNTYVLKKFATPEDVVLVKTLNLGKAIFPDFTVCPVLTSTQLPLNTNNYNRVWVDGSSLWTKEELDYLYHRLSSDRINQVVLLG